jgi:AcrR family transcriptional regulator
MLIAREEAIISAVNQLLVEKGYEGMTVDAVAALAGIAKASLYKHYPGKEDLAVAALSELLGNCLTFVRSIDSQLSPAEHLRQVVRWALRLNVVGRMPSLPASNGPLREALLSNKNYLDRLMELSDTLGAWIESAQASGQIAPDLPAVAVLYTLFARACDPVPQFLQATGTYSEDAIVALVERLCFNGLQPVQGAA